jgi:quinol monooxygenase YgiN
MTWRERGLDLSHPRAVRRGTVSGPFIFIGTHRITDGSLEAFKKDAQALVELVREHEPRMIAFNFFFNEDETEVSVVQVHPDADSMLTHMQVAHEHISQAMEELLVTKDIQIYGATNEAVVAMITQLTQAEVPLTVKAVHFDGFTRTA